MTTEAQTFDPIMDAIFKEHESGLARNGFYSPKISSLETYIQLKKKDNTYKRRFVYYLIDTFIKLKTEYIKSEYQVSNEHMVRQTLSEATLQSLMKSNLDFSPEDYIQLFRKFKVAAEAEICLFCYWPIGHLSLQMERSCKKNGLDEKLKDFLKELLEWPQMEGRSYYGADLDKIRHRVQQILFLAENSEGAVPPYHLPEDDFGTSVNATVAQLELKEQDSWYAAFHLFLTASNSKPKKKFLKESNAIIEEIGANSYKKQVQDWLVLAMKTEVKETQHEDLYGNYTHTFSTYEYLHEKNKVLLKGMIWSLSKFHDTATLTTLAKLAEKSFEKIPSIGPRAVGIGNACIYVLGHAKGLEGISQLSRLKLKIRQNNTKKLIDKYLSEASEKRGISIAEIEEISVPDFALKDGIKTYSFDDYTFKIEIEGIGKIKQQWLKPDGSPQKSVPAFVKSTVAHKKKLKKAREEVKKIKQFLTAQKDRIDRLFILDRAIPFEQFKTYYLNHGLVGFIAKRLLWAFKIGDLYTTLYFDGLDWKTLEGEIVPVKAEAVRLWHPIHAKATEIQAWRSLFDELKIKQPIKQIYREVYLLTDAEVNTRLYSNRMAAHILKQHQFNSLAGLRGWKYSLMGAFDDGIYDQTATKVLDSYDLVAQYWINEVNEDDAWNDSGMWNYVATDQVRFVDRAGETVPLIEIPKIVFSEVMRDVDLFVGVASVGNDPQWADNGGLVQYRDYWTSYSFGDLSEVAKTRKSILEHLVPRLKIRDKASIDGKFLRVEGKIRNYKIHIGSTNILMEPNDQYLCIVPSRGTDKKTENVFLPFEGDRGLSIILSKAFMLADDDKIDDPTITSQLTYK